MSRDQRPGKVKVYSGGETPAQHPLRRASDMVDGEIDALDAMDSEPAERSHWFLSALFVAGCVAGGGIFIALPNL